MKKYVSKLDCGKLTLSRKGAARAAADLAVLAKDAFQGTAAEEHGSATQPSADAWLLPTVEHHTGDQYLFPDAAEAAFYGSVNTAVSGA